VPLVKLVILLIMRINIIHPVPEFLIDA